MTMLFSPLPACSRAPASLPAQAPPQPAGGLPPEYGGYAGPEPTRYKDWEIKGRCSDF